MRAKSISREFFCQRRGGGAFGAGRHVPEPGGAVHLYFAQERRAALTGILDGAAAVSDQLAASSSSIVITEPIPDDARRQRAEKAMELFNTATQTLLFVTDDEGTVLLQPAATTC